MTHVVAHGHTLEAIASRYHVTVKAIVEANHLTDTKHLRVGEELRIPGVQAPPGKGSKGDAKAKTAKGKDGKGTDKAKPVTYAMRARTPGTVHAVRLATAETFTVKVSDHRSKVPDGALKAFERMLRSTSGLAHPIDARLVSLVGQVSNHFGSRPIQVISGFRPYTPTQHTPHSNHNIGRAIDFRVVGVPNEIVRDFCRKLKSVGVGYYPNSTFVHLDVRESPAFWIDFSRPGEPPRYNVANSGADEGTSDVAEDAKLIDMAVPTETTPIDPSVTPEPMVPSLPKPAADGTVDGTSAGKEEGEPPPWKAMPTTPPPEPKADTKTAPEDAP